MARHQVREYERLKKDSLSLSAYAAMAPHTAVTTITIRDVSVVSHVIPTDPGIDACEIEIREGMSYGARDDRGNVVHHGKRGGQNRLRYKGAKE